MTTGEGSTAQPQYVVVVPNKKSMLAAVLLTIFFGPLGLLYASILGGIILGILSIFLAAITPFVLGAGALLVWPFCVIGAIVSVHRNNKQARKAQ